MGSRINLKGQRFGKLIAIEYVGSGSWLCECDCGNNAVVKTGSLRSDSTKTCGCGNRKDILDKRFGNLTVIGFSHQEDNGRLIWNTICDCGSKKKVWVSNLTRGKVKSCGCLHDKPDLVGQRFGNGVVISEVPHNERRQSNRQEWVLACDCGNEYRVTTAQLRGPISKRTRSCGCYNKVTGEENPLWRGCHELSLTYFNRTRHGAVSRGYNFDVTIDEVWQLYLDQDKKCALTGWDINFSPASKINQQTASLDRIDSSQGYELGNIQWLHKDVNMIKNKYDNNYFIRLCCAVSENV